jgi:hypothetical protein
MSLENYLDSNFALRACALATLSYLLYGRRLPCSLTVQERSALVVRIPSVSPSAEAVPGRHVFLRHSLCCSILPSCTRRCWPDKYDANRTMGSRRALSASLTCDLGSRTDYLSADLPFPVTQSTVFLLFLQLSPSSLPYPHLLFFSFLPSFLGSAQLT